MAKTILVEAQHLDQQVYVADTYSYRNHFVQLAQLFSPFWGFGFSDVPAGVHTIEARMGVTPIRRTGTIISWIIVGVLAMLWFWPAQARLRQEPDEPVAMEKTSNEE